MRSGRSAEGQNESRTDVERAGAHRGNTDCERVLTDSTEENIKLVHGVILLLLCHESIAEEECAMR